MKYATAENADVFGTPRPQIFVFSRTPEGDALVFRIHQAAKKAIKALYPEALEHVLRKVHETFKGGLIAVDRKTQERAPKPSLAFLGEYAR